MALFVAFETDRNNIHDVLSGVAIMVMVFCRLFAAIHTRESFGMRNNTPINQAQNSLMAFINFGMLILIFLYCCFASCTPAIRSAELYKMLSILCHIFSAVLASMFAGFVSLHGSLTFETVIPFFNRSFTLRGLATGSLARFTTRAVAIFVPAMLVEIFKRLLFTLALTVSTGANLSIHGFLKTVLPSGLRSRCRSDTQLALGEHGKQKSAMGWVASTGTIIP